MAGQSPVSCSNRSVTGRALHCNGIKSAAKNRAEAQRLSRQWEAGDINEAEKRLTRKEILEVQQHLYRLGFDPRGTDGVAGPATRRAVKEYQRDRSISVDGKITFSLLKRLRKDTSIAGQSVEKKSSLSGTGFFVSENGHILTNAHVASDCRQVTLHAPPNISFTASVLATDNVDDLALLHAFRKPHSFASFRSGASPRIGEQVIVFGFPLAGALATSGNLVTGTLSALAGLANNPRHYQITAPIQPGNSGGPLLDERGQVIGVIVSKLNAARVAQMIGDIPQNVNFAIKGNVATSFLEANGVLPQFKKSDIKHSPAEIAELARTFSVRVECRK